MPGALSRFRMLDLSRQLPGPFCSMLLADLGMDVLAVYAPTDPMGMGIPLLGRNKRSLTLNLKAPEGRAIFHRLAREADVVLEGSRPGVAARLGVDWATLRELNPRLVYCSISGYGQDGPYRDRVGHDVNYLGLAGVIGLTGAADGPPAIPGVQIADIGGGALGPHFGRRLGDRLGVPELARRQFAEGEEREQMFATLRARFRERTMAEWVAELADLDICFGPVATLGEMMEDPQVRHRRMMATGPDGRRTLGNPVKLGATPPTLRTSSPSFGAHTGDVLAALGYSAGDVAGLRERG